MGQMRHLLRAYAVDTSDPGEVLRRTARAQARLLPDTLATVVYALLNPATGELSYANAGHPPPVWATPSGRAAYLDGASGVMLGAPIEPEFIVGHQILEPGTSLMFYTDGLIEDRSRDMSERPQRPRRRHVRGHGRPALLRSGPAPWCRPRCWAIRPGPTTCACWASGSLAYDASGRAALFLAGGRSGAAGQSPPARADPAMADLPERLHARYKA